LPSQTAQRAALPDLRLSEQFGIVVSFWYYRRRSSIILFSASHFISLSAFPTHAAYDDHDQRLN
jgi:hypothetical protein